MTPPAGTPVTWAIDADKLTCADQQETKLSKGDEVYVAAIAFRTTPGSGASTSAWFHGGLSDILNVRKGETHDIPNAMGRVSFANVTHRNLTDVLTGHMPELVGTATVVVESDLSPDTAVNKMFTQAATEARDIIARVVDAVNLGDLMVDGDSLAERLKVLIDEVNAVLRPNLAQKLAMFFGSLGDPDDLIDHKLNVFAAVDDSLAGPVEDELGDAIPESVGVGGVLKSRAYTQRFSGRGAIYDISFTVGK